jgi:hypothetical protein
VPFEDVVRLRRGDPAGDGPGEHEQPVGGAAVVAAAVVEHGEADPRPPQRREQAERGGGDSAGCPVTTPARAGRELITNHSNNGRLRH